MLTIAAVLLTALLFGGMTLYSFAFAAFLFHTLPAAEAGSLLRRAFPFFYLFVIVVALLAAVCAAPLDGVAALQLAAVALTAVPARQCLMPAINAATDAGDRRRFAVLHGVSVAVTLGHIAISAMVLTRFLP